MTVNTRVKNGALALDALQPYWAHSVSTENLCLDSLLIDVFGDVREGIQQLMDKNYSSRYTNIFYLQRGFGILTEARAEPHIQKETAALLVQWHKQIEARLVPVA